MRKIVLGIALAAITGSGSYAADCIAQSFQQYLTGAYTCTIPTNSGIVTFSNFSLDTNFVLSGGSGTLVAPGNISVNPFGFGAYTYGLTLSGAFHVDNTQQYVLQFHYDVSSPAAVTGATLAFLDATTTCTGVNCGNVTLTKEIFAIPVGALSIATASVDDVQGVSAEVPFGPLATFQVHDTLTLAANHNAADATSFGNDFLTPEPATLSLAGLALVGFALYGRKRRS